MNILESLRLSLQAILGGYEFKKDESVVLTGYFVIAAWSTADGETWLTRTHGDLNDEGLPDWTAKGFLQYALSADDRAPASDDS